MNYLRKKEGLNLCYSKYVMNSTENIYIVFTSFSSTRKSENCDHLFEIIHFES